MHLSIGLFTFVMNISFSPTCFAKKPLKSGFKKALEKLEMKPEQVAVVGDQIFTDVVGAKRMKMFSILVKQVGEKCNQRTP